jgi:16S rRNA G966 N2-methylase RsmD
MRKMYLSAPLPFVGQKRMFAKEFVKVLKRYPESTVFVDLFGGSGLLSHITKYQCPNATVVYNDFDNYRQRLANIRTTNILLEDLRKIVIEVPRHQLISSDLRNRIYERIGQDEKHHLFVDYITISSSIMFSMKYKMSLEELRREALYNNIRKNDYPCCDDYLDGLIITSCDYKELFHRYKDIPNVVFIVDPPYLSTDVGTYKMGWNLSDYLDVINVLKNNQYIYFTSNKSSILELCDWIGKNKNIGNPFENCYKSEFNAHMNFNSTYTDIMLYKSLCISPHKTA